MSGLIENVIAFLRGALDYMANVNAENSQWLIDELFGEED